MLQGLYYSVAVLTCLGFFPKIPVVSKLANICSYFLMANLAAGLGVIKSLMGQKVVVWKKAESTR
jgi:hypothetical protein